MALSPEAIAEEAVELLRPLATALRTPEGTHALLARVGVARDAGDLAGPVAQLGALAAAIEGLARRLDGRIEALPDALDALEAVREVHRAMPLLERALADLRPPPRMLGDLLSLLLVAQLLEAHPALFQLLTLLGVLYREEVPADASPGSGDVARIAFRLDWARLGKAITSPGDLARDVYGWGTAAFDAPLLVLRLSRLAEAMGGQVRTDDVGPALLRAVAPSLGARPPWLAELVLFSAETDVASVRVGLAVMPAEGTAPSDAGVAAMPIAEGDLAAEIPLGDQLGVTVEASAAMAGGVVALLRPQSGLSWRVGVLDGNVGAAIDGALGLRWRSPGAVPLLGSARGPHLAASAAAVRVALAEADLSVELSLDDAALVVPSEGVDSFLRSVLPPDGLRVACGLAVGWSSSKGLSFRGGAGTEVTLPLHVSVLGVLDVESVYLALKASETAIRAAAAASFRVSLGPLELAVENLGVEAVLDARAQRRNLGVVDLSVVPRPPDGAALTVNGTALRGSGFLAHDEAKGEYAGALELAAGDALQLKAIGILTTRLPGGQAGYSLLVVVTAEFPPLPLGLGFTLHGVGGLLGANRRAAVDALRASLRSGALDSFFFPRDPRGDPAGLVRSVTDIFPVAAGRYVFGPMARIGWGSPTLLTLDLALLLEVPDPVRLVVLGRLTALLPDAAAPVAVVRMDAVGVVDLARGELSLDATLRDSRLLDFTLTGEMALRLRWGARPEFLLAIGGFNPRFSPPPGTPALARLGINFVDRPEARLRLDAYLALTSNTVQFGARVDFLFAALGARAEGVLAFDALFHFAPFELTADLAALVTLSFDGAAATSAEVVLTLTGPTPWRLVGRARLDLLGTKADVPIELTVGAARPPRLPAPVVVFDLVRAALADARSWSVLLPDGAVPAATLRPIADGTPGVLAHPLGTVSIRQRVAPLRRTLARFGNAPVQGDARVEVRAFRGGSAQPLITGVVEEQFAMGQYLALSDDEKLARPAFETAEAGLQLGDAAFAFSEDAVLATTVRYTLLVVEGGAPARAAADAPSPASVDAATAHAAAAVAPARAATLALGRRVA